MNCWLSFDSVAEEEMKRLSIVESEGFEASGSLTSAWDAKATNLASGRSFMSNVMDTLLMRNTSFKSAKSKPTDGGVQSSLQNVVEIGPDGSEAESPFLQDVRTKCVIQLLLLDALDSLQNNHWQGLQPSHKRLVMDTLLSMVDFAASYNSGSKLQSRMQPMSGDMPPPNLLRQENKRHEDLSCNVEQTITESGDEVETRENMEQGGEDLESGEISWKGGEQKLREEVERQLVPFCGHGLKEIAALQPDPCEAVLSDFHRALHQL
ncbi:brefeldin A-inhibited guanine nucleotide-exchange protein 5-like [Physcomitrium patens]|uniref:Sec7/BIG1-like C-terminal domain-containing protein n=1 Tax=Physcomitrium patens TaxID=3218 RepID=A0A2K1KK17_PHYPA|nr:hypothetical protein PHYPA_007779 [Physcomitrium patens]